MILLALFFPLVSLVRGPPINYLIFEELRIIVLAHIIKLQVFLNYHKLHLMHKTVFGFKRNGSAIRRLLNNLKLF